MEVEEWDPGVRCTVLLDGARDGGRCTVLLLMEEEGEYNVN